MKTIFKSTFPPLAHTNSGFPRVLVLICAFFAAVDLRADPSKTYAFSVNASGPFTTTPVSPTVLRQDQLLSFASAMPFPLTTGSVQGFDNLTIPTFPDRFFNGTFAWFGVGGDAVFGTLTVQTSVFTDPVNPAAGDFIGSEDFTGTFQFTNGTGRYLNATGGGVYVAHSEYGPPTQPGTLFFGSTTVTATGTVAVVAAPPHPAQPIEITVLRDKTTTPSTKTWSSTGALVDAGVWSILQSHFDTPKSPQVSVFQLDARFTNTYETGTFTVRMEVVNRMDETDPEVSISTGKWAITDATGIYAGLDGRGTLEGIDNVDLTTNTLSGEVMFK